MTRPTALPVQVSAIPDVLTCVPRWMNWRYTWDDKGERWSKVPFQPCKLAAKANDPSTWSTFAEAVAALRDFDGIGFALSDGWSGIDLDHCPPDEPLLTQLPCYVERSPSGTGYKAIGRSARVGGEIHFERHTHTPWTRARYFAITGHGVGDPAVDITAIIDQWFPIQGTRAVLGAVPTYIRVGDTRGTELIERYTDDQVVERVLGSVQADRFLKLCRGDVSDYGGDHSRADQALCSILIYWSNGDVDQVDRLFRQSGLMRDKWNVRSYREATLRKAVLR